MSQRKLCEEPEVDRQPAVKLLQINTNRSRLALDMALYTGKKLGASVLLVSEPNQLTIDGRKDWIHDDRLDSAIKILDDHLILTNQAHGKGFTYVTTADYTIYSCYFSGNKEIQDLEESLWQIRERIQSNKETPIIAGDFNAKSPQWGMNHTDSRGVVLTEWIAENKLAIANTESSRRL